MERKNEVTITMFKDGTTDVGFLATDVTEVPAEAVAELNAVLTQVRDILRQIYTEQASARYISVSVGV